MCYFTRVVMLRMEARRQQVAPKLQYISNELHGFTVQKTDLNIHRSEIQKKLNNILLGEK